jgi:hypothetical protein
LDEIPQNGATVPLNKKRSVQFLFFLFLMKLEWPVASSGALLKLKNKNTYREQRKKKKTEKTSVNQFQ